MSAAELIKSAPISINRSGWAMRGAPEFVADAMLAVEVAPDGWDKGAEILDKAAASRGKTIVEVQKVQRRNARALYARLG